MTRALANITILDFSRFLPGAYPGWIAGDMGADVIRIEHPREVAKMAVSDPVAERLRRARPTYQRNKRSMTLNPTHPAAREILNRLIARADVLVEDYRPGAMAAMGLDYASVAAINPRIVYCSVSFAGQTGPLVGKAGHDPGALALSGALSRLNGTARPTLPGAQIADVLAGAHASVAVLAALLARERSGRGDHIDIAMSEASLPLLMVALGRADDPATLGPSDGSFHPKGGVWECGDGRYLCTTDMEPAYWQRFCVAIGRADFAPLRDQPSHWPRLGEEIAQVMRTRSRDEWMEILSAADTQATPVLSPAEALGSTLMQARDMVHTVDTPDGPVTQIAPPFHFASATAAEIRPGGAAGAEIDAILAECGFDATEGRALHASGAFTSRDRS